MNEKILEDRIHTEIKKLESIALKYDELNRKTKGRYLWRLNAIYDEIGVLECVLKGHSVAENWNACYEEDLILSK